MGVEAQPLAERIDRWAIRHPHAPLERRLLRLPVVLWRIGLGRLAGQVGVRGGHLVLLTVTGRTTGLPRHTPVMAHVLDGRTYLWCPYGRRSHWYRNVVANPVVTVQSGRGTRAMRAVAIDDVDEGIEVVTELHHFDAIYLRSYLDAEGIADTPDAIAANLQRLHLRRLEPTQQQGPPALTADLAWLWLVPVAAAALGVGRRCRRRRNRQPRSWGRSATSRRPSSAGRGRARDGWTRIGSPSCFGKFGG